MSMLQTRRWFLTNAAFAGAAGLGEFGTLGQGARGGAAAGSHRIL